MPLQIIVLAKQVPDTKRITGSAMKEDGTVNRAALPAIFNPEDLNALEMALQLKEKYIANVIVLSMGPPQASEILRQSLYRGVDNAILLTDKSFAGADTWATAYTLSAAIKKIGAYDLILCGRQAIDGDTAQTGPQVAEKLALIPLTYVEEIEWIREKSIRLKRNLGNGYEIVEAELPLLLTVTSSANIPRPHRAKLLLQYFLARTPSELWSEERTEEIEELKEKGLLIEEWDARQIHADKNSIGLSGSLTRVHKIENIVLVAKGFKEFKPIERDIKELMSELKKEHTFD
jgi:electron transfer flavoprotein beta subunit